MVEFNPLRRFNPVRRLNVLVDLNVVPGFDKMFQEQVEVGDPISVFTHEAHADGIGAAVVGEHLLRLSRKTTRTPELKGWVMPAARSFVDGQQGRRLQIAFHIFNFLVSRKGLKTFPYTRRKDEEQYHLNRDHTTSELLPMARRIRQGFAPAVFAGGSVEAGRHDEGADPENIHGLQRLEGADLITLSRLVKSVNKRRRIFFIIVGLHGGFRLQSPNKEKLYPTKEGIVSFLGWPERFYPHIRHVRMEANLGTIIPEEQITERFGDSWVRAGQGKNGGVDERVQAFNNYIMEQAALLMPPHTRGVYANVCEENLIEVYEAKIPRDQSKI